MKVSFRLFVLLCTLLSVSAGVIRAQEAVKTKPAAAGFLADFTGQVTYVQKQIMELEDATPAEKFKWRPAEGVRSIAEVYHHMAFASYVILKFAGYEPPADANFVMDPKKWESSTLDKNEIAQSLQKSFDHLHATTAKLSESDLEKQVSLFGNETTLRGALLTTLSHLHEHLGQSVAYARMNGIVPPWTLAEQEAERKAMEKKATEKK